MWLPAASYSTAQQVDFLKTRLVFESVGRVWGYSYMGACLYNCTYMLSVYCCIYLSRLLFPLSLPPSLSLSLSLSVFSHNTPKDPGSRSLARPPARCTASRGGFQVPTLARLSRPLRGPFQPAVSKPTKSRFRSQRPRHTISFTLKRTQIMKNKKLIQRSKQRQTPSGKHVHFRPLIRLRLQRLVTDRSAPGLVEGLLQRLDGQLALLRTISVHRMAVRRM